MATYLASIDVMLKPLVNDPQGLAVLDGLGHLGFAGVQKVRVGKRIEVTVDAADSDAAESAVTEMCQKLLANPVIENFSFELAEVAAAGRLRPEPFRTLRRLVDCLQHCFVQRAVGGDAVTGVDGGDAFIVREATAGFFDDDDEGGDVPLGDDAFEHGFGRAIGDEAVAPEIAESSGAPGAPEESVGAGP